MRSFVSAPLVSVLCAASTARLAACLLVMFAVVAFSSCSREQKHESTALDSTPPRMKVTHPRMRNIVRVIEQPGFVEAYQRALIYPELAAYVKKSYVEVGDRVKSDQILAELFIPGVEEDRETGKAIITLDQQKIDLARRALEVAANDLRMAEAALFSARSNWRQYNAEVVRRDSEVKRLRPQAPRGGGNAGALSDAENELRTSTSARDAAKLGVDAAEANLESRKADLRDNEAALKAAVNAAQADVKMAVGDWKRLHAGMSNLKLHAPFDGVVVSRNASAGDFVIPATDDPSADHGAADTPTTGTAAPVYVIDRTDVVRVVVDIPERDANFVQVGAKATVLVGAYSAQPIAATVTRTSWAAGAKGRTLRAEIDLPNPGSKIPTDLPVATQEALALMELPNPNHRILPGMYTDNEVIIERPQVLALPVAALTYSDDRAYYWSYEQGKAIRTEVQTGLSDGEYIEVVKRRQPRLGSATQKPGPASQPASERAVAKLQQDGAWAPLTGSEDVILGKLSALTDGSPVQISTASDDKGDAAIHEAPDVTTKRVAYESFQPGLRFLWAGCVARTPYVSDEFAPLSMTTCFVGAGPHGHWAPRSDAHPLDQRSSRCRIPANADRDAIQAACRPLGRAL